MDIAVFSLRSFVFFALRKLRECSQCKCECGAVSRVVMLCYIGARIDGFTDSLIHGFTDSRLQ